MTFVGEARAAAAKWKESLIPESARAPAPYGRRPGDEYPFCLPLAHANLNLLDEARAAALAHFDDDRIAWHDGVNGGPSNHLLDSQVQCVNALAPFMRDGESIRELFGRILDIAKVL